MAQTFANLAETSLSEDIDGTTTTVPVEDRSDFSQSGQFGLLLQASDSEQNRELMEVTGGHGTGPGSFTVVRGSTPIPHAANSYVAQVLTAKQLEQFVQAPPQTATVTTDPDTFVVSHTFDLAHPTVFFATATVTVLTADGETFGSGSGQIAVDMFSVSQSADNVNFRTIAPADWYHDDLGLTVDQVAFDLTGITGRYVSFDNIRIIDPVSFDVYAGVNHPSASVRLDITSG
jgi:hypothetical protein